MAVWIHGTMDAWQFGFMALWMHDSLDSWHYGCMAVWIYGTMDAWQFGFMALWMHGSLDSWHSGCMAVWICGTMDAWQFGFTAQCIYGSLDSSPRCDGLDTQTSIHLKLRLRDRIYFPGGCTFHSLLGRFMDVLVIPLQVCLVTGILSSSLNP